VKLLMIAGTAEERPCPGTANYEGLLTIRFALRLGLEPHGSDSRLPNLAY
jgi:hypothetical protein